MAFYSAMKDKNFDEIKEIIHNIFRDQVIFMYKNKCNLDCKYDGCRNPNHNKTVINGKSQINNILSELGKYNIKEILYSLEMMYDYKELYKFIEEFFNYKYCYDKLMSATYNENIYIDVKVLGKQMNANGVFFHIKEKCVKPGEYTQSTRIGFLISDQGIKEYNMYHVSKEEIMERIKVYNNSMLYCPKSYLSDKELWLSILKINGHCIKHASREIKDDITYMNIAISQSGNYLRKYSKVFRKINKLSCLTKI